MALEYEGAPLTLQRKQDFVTKKAAEREEKEAAARAQVRWTLCWHSLGPDVTSQPTGRRSLPLRVRAYGMQRVPVPI